MRKIPVLTQQEYEIASHPVNERVSCVEQGNAKIFDGLGYAMRMAGSFPK